MTDALGTRAVLAMLFPATNTMVEPDLASLQPSGVTNQTFRFPFPALPASPERLLELMAPVMELMLACEPDHLLLGSSPEYMPQAGGVALRAVNRAEVDGLLQVGTNLVATSLVVELEQGLGKPVIAVNTASYWHALRQLDLDAPVPGHGQWMRL